MSEKGAKNDKRRDSTSLHSCGFLGFCFLIRDLAFHGSHLCNSRFSRENQIQVGEDHDLGWHSSDYLCNCGSNLSDLYLLLKERIKPLVEALYDKLPWIWEVSLSRYWDRLIDFLDRYLWACAQRIQTGIRKQKGEFVVTFSCRVKKRLYARAIEVGIHLSLLSNLFWILKTTLAVGYRLLWVLYYIISFEGFLGSFRLYLVYFGFYCLLFSGKWLRTSEDRGERQAQISGILLRGMLIECAFSVLCLEEDSNLHAL